MRIFRSEGQDDRHLGYGSQGHAQAQNLRDSGCKVIVGQLAGSPNYDLAVEHGFEPMPVDEAVKAGRPHQILLPDEVQGDVYRQKIRRQSEARQHPDVLARLQYPFRSGRTARRRRRLAGGSQGPGHLVRSEYVKGRRRSLPDRGRRGAATQRFQLGLAYAKGIGGTRGGVIETTFAEETETDLFGEQVVLCGGVSELVKAGFETLVEAGYQPEMAYFECMHELKLIVDLFYQGGLNYMRYSVSNTAEYGDYTRGPRIITDETKQDMKQILTEIQNGEFAGIGFLKIGPVRLRSKPRDVATATRDRIGRTPTAQTDELD